MDNSFLRGELAKEMKRRSVEPFSTNNQPKQLAEMDNRPKDGILSKAWRKHNMRKPDKLRGPVKSASGQVRQNLSGIVKGQMEAEREAFGVEKARGFRRMLYED